MVRPIELSDRDRRIVAVLLTDTANLSQWPIMKLSKTSSARVNILLARLEKAELVTSDQQNGLESQRTFYRLTEGGRAWAMAELSLEA